MTAAESILAIDPAVTASGCTYHPCGGKSGDIANCNRCCRSASIRCRAQSSRLDVARGNGWATSDGSCGTVDLGDCAVLRPFRLYGVSA